MKRENKLKLSGYELKINTAKLFLYPCLLLPSKFFFFPFYFSPFGNAQDQLASIFHVKTIRSGRVAGSKFKTVVKICWIPSSSPQVISVTESGENHRQAVFVCSARLLIEGIMRVSVEICSSPKNEKKHRTMF